jgi:hypothetical protein
MRFQAIVKIDIPGVPEGTTSDRSGFWQALRRWVGRSTESFDEEFDLALERRFQIEFPQWLEASLRRHVPDITVILREFHYSSLDLNLDLLSSAINNLGLTTDDFLALLVRYTPHALIGSTIGGYSGSPPPLQVSATGQMVASIGTGAAPVTSGPPAAQSRAETLWWIANTSLVLPALLLLAGAFFMFQNASDERRKMTDALVQERTAIFEQRQRMIERYEAQLILLRHNDG